MALQHLRSSTANKRPLPAGMSDGQLAINTNAASPGLFFKDSSGNLVKTGPVHVGTTAPNASPASGGATGNSTGELWLDTSVSPNQLKTWNGSAWVSDFPDEIPVAKLADGAARQLLQTDAAGTGVEWTSNVDVPGTLDVTSTATFDSIASHPLGSAGAPTITFTGDTNTGIYSPGADQLALSTNGVQRINIEADGDINIDSGGVFYDATNNRLAIGTTSVNAPLHVSNGGAAGLEFYPATYEIQAYNRSTSSYGLARYNAAGHQFAVSASEAARIDSSGRLLVGTSSSVGFGCSLQVVNASGINAEIIRNSADGGGPTYALGKSRGSAGSPASVNSGDNLGTINFRGYDGSDYREAAFIQAAVDGTPGANDMPARLVFSTTADGSSSPTERARIDSSGRLLVGTSSSTGSISNTAPVIAGLFQSFDDVATFTTGVAQTLFAIPNTNATYIVTLRRGSVGDAANYEAVSILSTNAGGSVSAVLTDLKTAANVSISISGTNLQGTQTSGGNASLRWIVTRVG